MKIYDYYPTAIFSSRVILLFHPCRVSVLLQVHLYLWLLKTFNPILRWLFLLFDSKLVAVCQHVRTS